MSNQRRYHADANATDRVRLANKNLILARQDEREAVARARMAYAAEERRTGLTTDQQAAQRARIAESVKRLNTPPATKGTK